MRPATFQDMLAQAGNQMAARQLQRGAGDDGAVAGRVLPVMT